MKLLCLLPLLTLLFSQTGCSYTTGLAAAGATATLIPIIGDNLREASPGHRDVGTARIRLQRDVKITIEAKDKEKKGSKITPMTMILSIIPLLLIYGIIAKIIKGRRA